MQPIAWTSSKRWTRRSLKLRCRDRTARRHAARAAPDEANGSPACAVPAVILNLGSRLVACRDHQALPRGSAHRSALARQPRYESIGSKNVRPDRTPQGMERRQANRDVFAFMPNRRTAARTAFPGRPAPGRSPFASHWILRRAASPSISAHGRRRLGAPMPPRRSRSSSCAMLSAAITAMRSVPLTLPASRISRMRRSSSATASGSSSRSPSLHATLNSRPRIEMSSVTVRARALRHRPPCIARRSFAGIRAISASSARARLRACASSGRDCAPATASSSRRSDSFAAAQLARVARSASRRFSSSAASSASMSRHYRRRDRRVNHARRARRTGAHRRLGRERLVAHATSDSSSSTPPGVRKVTVSPSRAFSSARAIGEIQLM